MIWSWLEEGFVETSPTTDIDILNNIIILPPPPGVQGSSAHKQIYRVPGWQSNHFLFHLRMLKNGILNIRNCTSFLCLFCPVNFSKFHHLAFLKNQRIPWTFPLSRWVLKRKVYAILMPSNSPDKSPKFIFNFGFEYAKEFNFSCILIFSLYKQICSAYSQYMNRFIPCIQQIHPAKFCSKIYLISHILCRYTVCTDSLRVFSV
jgi:hypothetical protein